MQLSDKMLKETCKLGQGNDCCRYIIADPEKGIVCAKKTPLKETIDANVHHMTAKADNCEGVDCD